MAAALWLDSWPTRQGRSGLMWMSAGLTKQMVKWELCTSTESLFNLLIVRCSLNEREARRKRFADQAKAQISTPATLPKPTRLATPNMIEGRVVCVTWALIEDSKNTYEWASYSTRRSRAICSAKTHVSNDWIWALIYIYIWTITPLWWVTHKFTYNWAHEPMPSSSYVGCALNEQAHSMYSTCI